ncbi:hypothetical protein [Bradyrhizobium tunisiense]|uniref:hypothetical protein n=1 Tax=Bradyrhizobium tunisiense TaxID=3278709 RepID=UPI0035D5F27D
MANTPMYAPNPSGLDDDVGIPMGNETGTGGTTGEAFDFGGVFNQVKSWLVKNDDKVIQVVVPWLKKQLKNVSGLDALDLPNSTPITQMVLPSQVTRLSPAVKRLTKLDLMALGGWGVARKLPSELGLTAKDIQTIRDVFTPRMTGGAGLDEEPEAFSLSCCSCTPCCCAASVTKPLRQVA